MNTPWPYPLWIAHRGAGKLAPENTLAAFRLGAQHGYTAFECDVKLSRDDIAFLLHDAALERTTNGVGVAGELPWSDLSQLDAGGWHSPHYAGEPLPTMTAIAHYVRSNRFQLNIEVKPTPGEEERTGRIVARAAARLWQSDAIPPLLSSFKPAALHAAQQEAPTLPRALLLDTLWDGWFERAQSLACVAIVAHHPLWDERLVARVHACGMRALAYTVNDDAIARRMQAISLDGLITDAIDRFAPGETLA